MSSPEGRANDWRCAQLAEQALDASVILATYNQRESTSLALRALFAQQTEYSYEVIVCDDGSDAATVGALQQLLQDAPIPARLVWQQDRAFRLAASRNNGVRLSRGRILIFMDGDLVPEAGFVQQHIAAHVRAGLIVVGKRLYRRSESIPAHAGDPQTLWDWLRADESSDQGTRFHEATEMLGRHYLWKHQPWLTCYGCNISVMNSDLVEFDEDFETWGNEDWDLFFRLNTAHGHEVAFTDATVYEVEGRTTDWSQAEYAGHLLSGLRFYSKWAHTGLAPRFALPLYELDPVMDTWRSSRMPIHGWTHDDPEAYVALVRDWLTRHGYLGDEPGLADPGSGGASSRLERGESHSL